MRETRPRHPRRSHPVFAPLIVSFFLLVLPFLWAAEKNPPPSSLSTATTVSLARNPASFPDTAFAGAWAQLIVKPSLENCYKISDTLYRGAQPTREGFEELKKMGVRTVVNLRSNHSDKDLLPEGMREVRIPMTIWKAETSQILKFLDTVTDPRNQPVFVHCQEGVDRTGLMCAVYRVLAGGWEKDQAVEEMKQIGAHDILVNLKNYMKKLDVEALRRQLAATPLSLKEIGHDKQD
jgi:protein tyrosine phosphatase (PTP) superfamily phosphohydrolase (DUF442 family)